MSDDSQNATQFAPFLPLPAIRAVKQDRTGPRNYETDFKLPDRFDADFAVDECIRRVLYSAQVYGAWHEFSSIEFSRVLLEERKLRLGHPDRRYWVSLITYPNGIDAITHEALPRLVARRFLHVNDDHKDLIRPAATFFKLLEVCQYVPV